MHLPVVARDQSAHADVQLQILQPQPLRQEHDTRIYNKASPPARDGLLPAFHKS